MKIAAFVIPAFNPPDDWQQRLANELAQTGRDLSLEVVVVDDASNMPIEIGQLQQLLPQARVRLLRFEHNRGKGAAVREGLKLCERADYYFYTDSDFPYRPRDAAEMMRVIDNGADVVPGVRDQSYFANIPPFRRRISKLLSAMVGAAVSYI